MISPAISGRACVISGAFAGNISCEKKVGARQHQDKEKREGERVVVLETRT